MGKKRDKFSYKSGVSYTPIFDDNGEEIAFITSDGDIKFVREVLPETEQQILEFIKKNNLL